MEAVANIRRVRSRDNEAGKLVPPYENLFRNLSQWTDYLSTANGATDLLEHFAWGDVVVRRVLPDVDASRPFRDIKLTQPAGLRQRVEVVSKLVTSDRDRAAIRLVEPKTRKDRFEA